MDDLRSLQASLRKITETLAQELAAPSCTGPDWTAVELRLAKAVAAMHGVSPLLARRLRWQGPPDWVGFLEQQRSHTAIRHVRVLALLQRIDRSLREAGIAGLALKGAALHAMGLYQAGERPMADIDLLVDPKDAARTAALIESLGFLESFASWKERAFVPTHGCAAAQLGEHAQNDVKIELHERVCEMLPRQLTDISALLWTAELNVGLNAYPSSAALMLHLLLHAAGNMVFKALRLLHLHDLALLSWRMRAADWNELGERVGEQRLWWALPPLQVAARYYSLPLPAHLRATLHAACPPLLARISQRRRLTEVSFSHLWVDAFPGLEWSQSVPQMVGYIASRIRPNAANVAVRVSNLSTQPWASATPWSALSQTRRMVRWATSRQTRPVSMHAVNAALGAAPCESP
jgi:hypothetical protein